MSELPHIHYTEPTLYDGRHPVTVALVGLGGNGSRMLQHLGCIHAALQALGHPGLLVSAFDGDTITEANVARQLFSSADLGFNKAEALITRVNRFYGTDWEGFPQFLDADLLRREPLAFCHNVVITCVDSWQARQTIGECYRQLGRRHQRAPYRVPWYWLDLGNARDVGQVQLGTLQAVKQPDSTQYQPVGKLDNWLDLYGHLRPEQEDNTPSCSLAEALGKQNLFINAAMALYAAELLWRLLHDKRLLTSGCFVNLAQQRTNPIRL